MDKFSPYTPEFIAECLTYLITSEKAKLDFGARQRTRVQNDLAAGTIDMSDYRPKWLVETATKLWEQLNKEAKAFNARYPYDKISFFDLSDVVRTLEKKVVLSAKEKARKMKAD